MHDCECQEINILDTTHVAGWKFTLDFQSLISLAMQASGHAAGARVSERWVCGTSASLFQLTVKAPLALLVCQREHQRSESSTSSSWVCATDGHLHPLTNFMKRNAYLTQRNTFVWHLAPERLYVCRRLEDTLCTFTSLIFETFIYPLGATWLI